MSVFTFYSVSDRKKIESRVDEKINASKGTRKTFILKGHTPEGKILTALVSEKVFNETVID